MITLHRTVRFSVGHGADATAGPNGHGGSPRVPGLGLSCALRVACRGRTDPQTGYLINIKAIDRAVRELAVPMVSAGLRRGAPPEPVLLEIARALAEHLPTEVVAVRWLLTPTWSLEYDMSTPARVTIRQRFEFAASHRLHVAELDEGANRALFGKCNNPNGHGHNYVLEPAVVCEASPGRPPRFTLADLEAVTERTIIDRFDHKHLNLDTAEFGPGGVNPSVENIARIVYELLAPEIAGAGAQLAAVTVWETERTSATFPA
jgi:6-pyruvoyltetrahydropterin/6-carboxytetrahydropterin synthase